MTNNMTFEELVWNVQRVHSATSRTAKTAINQMLTVRNWAIGCYIVEFEQNGQRRSVYGSHLLEDLSNKIAIKGLDRSMLNICRNFYLKYPQICDSVNHRLKGIGLPDAIAAQIKESRENIRSQICDSANHKFETNPETLITRLSFTHIREILTLDDPFERFFYEFECIKGTWSVRELRRQIATNLYVRAGLSQKPEILLDQIQAGTQETALSVKDPFSLEFLGLNPRIALTESDLEQAIMDHLQEFLLELGKGFCFEARQKRIIIDDEYYFADLVLYNRLLHCNVIIELKVDKFRYEHFGQLNSYVSYYKDCEMAEGDNPPIGILLCTGKGDKMVEYVLNGIDEKIFVSTYMLHLPDKKQLEEFLAAEMTELGIDS